MEKLSNQRIKWLDTAKGILILLVILGHSFSNTELKNILGSFYMPAFFIFSGFTLKYEKNKKFTEMLKKRGGGVLLPYLMFSVLWIIFQFLKQLAVPADFNVKSAIISIFLPYSGRPHGNVYIYWFLPCLFLAHVGAYLILSANKYQKTLGVGLLLIYLIIGLYVSNASLLICSAFAAIFMLIGFLLKQLLNAKPINKIQHIIIALVSALLYFVMFYINVIFLKNTLDYSSADFGNIIFFFFGAVFGTVVLCYISFLLVKLKVLTFIGKNSLTYYLIHFFFISIISFAVHNDLIVMILTIAFTTVSVWIYNKLGIDKLFNGRKKYE